MDHWTRGSETERLKERMTNKKAGHFALLGLFAALLGCSEQDGKTAEWSASAVELEELKAAFNSDMGKARLILLLAPT